MGMITSREQFSEYCLRRLGKGVITINISNDQLQDRIDDAVHKFRLRHFDAIEERYLVKEIGYDDAMNGYIQLPAEIIGVVEILQGPTVSGDDGQTVPTMFDFEYQINLNDYLRNNGMYSYSGKFSQIYIMKSNINMMRWVVQKENRFEFNKLTHRLFIYDDLETMADQSSSIAIRTYMFVGEIAELWTDEWLKDYATQLIKRQWADNLRKYGSVTLPSGVTLNGDAMFSEATTEIQRLEDLLKTDYELPFDFFIG
jgi:hypothetical protein